MLHQLGGRSTVAARDLTVLGKLGISPPQAYVPLLQDVEQSVQTFSRRVQHLLTALANATRCDVCISASVVDSYEETDTSV